MLLDRVHWTNLLLPWEALRGSGERRIAANNICQSSNISSLGEITADIDARDIDIYPTYLTLSTYPTMLYLQSLFFSPPPNQQPSTQHGKCTQWASGKGMCADNECEGTTCWIGGWKLLAPTRAKLLMTPGVTESCTIMQKLSQTHKTVPNTTAKFRIDLGTTRTSRLTYKVVTEGHTTTRSVKKQSATVCPRYGFDAVVNRPERLWP